MGQMENLKDTISRWIVIESDLSLNTAARVMKVYQSHGSEILLL